MTLDIKKKIYDLQQYLKQAEHDYYSGQSKIPDELYDAKLRDLIALEDQYPEYIVEDSPTRNIGKTPISDDVPKVQHQMPMLSLANVYNNEEAIDFFKQIEGSGKEYQYFVEPKIDGASISLVYKDNYLQHAISRGDGAIGEDLTDKIKQLNQIPLYVPSGPGNFTVRGEIFITKDDFALIKSEAEAQNIYFAHHRNYVSGTLRLKNKLALKGKRLSACFYYLYVDGVEGSEEGMKALNISTQQERIECLRQLGFPTHESRMTCLSSDKDEIFEFLGYFLELKEGWEVPTDGMVIKVNDVVEHEDIGYTAKAPKWAFAYKYPSEIKETKLKDITLTVGRSGRITYLAEVEPIEISSTTVSFATLNNYRYIADLGIRIGDIVRVYKSGEIIPQIIGYVESKDRESLPEYALQTQCPSCASTLVLKGEKLQYCENEDCFDKKLAQLTYFVSRQCMNIEGLSIQILRKLIELDIVKDITSIYEIENYREKIIKGNVQIKDKTFDNLVKSINNSKGADQFKVLAALGIDQVGRQTSKLLLKRFGNIDSVLGASIEDISSIKGIGKVVGNEIVEWSKVERNRDVVKRFKELGLIKQGFIKDDETVDTWLKGKSVVITGSFLIDRNKLTEILENKFGVLVKKSISKKIDFMIVGDSPGSKAEEGRKMGIKSLNMSDLSSLDLFN